MSVCNALTQQFQCKCISLSALPELCVTVAFQRHTFLVVATKVVVAPIGGISRKQCVRVAFGLAQRANYPNIADAERENGQEDAYDVADEYPVVFALGPIRVTVVSGLAIRVIRCIATAIHGLHRLVKRGRRGGHRVILIVVIVEIVVVHFELEFVHALVEEIKAGYANGEEQYAGECESRFGRREDLCYLVELNIK